MNINNKRRLVKLRRVYRAVDQFMELSMSFYMNLVAFNGRVGNIDFDADEDYADGHLILREFGDQRMVSIPFRIENRWLVRDGRPTPAMLNAIISIALDQGYKPAHVKWDGRLLMPYHLPALGLRRRPDDKVLPKEVRWMEPASEDQYKGDPLARYGGIVHRC